MKKLIIVTLLTFSINTQANWFVDTGKTILDIILAVPGATINTVKGIPGMAKGSFSNNIALNQLRRQINNLNQGVTLIRQRQDKVEKDMLSLQEFSRGVEKRIIFNDQEVNRMDGALITIGNNIEQLQDRYKKLNIRILDLEQKN